MSQCQVDWWALGAASSEDFWQVLFGVSCELSPSFSPCFSQRHGHESLKYIELSTWNISIEWLVWYHFVASILVYLKIMGNPDWPERKPDMPTKVLIFEMLSGQAPWDSMGYDDNTHGATFGPEREHEPQSTPMPLHSAKTDTKHRAQIVQQSADFNFGLVATKATIRVCRMAFCRCLSWLGRLKGIRNLAKLLMRPSCIDSRQRLHQKVWLAWIFCQRLAPMHWRKNTNMKLWTPEFLAWQAACCKAGEKTGCPWSAGGSFRVWSKSGFPSDLAIERYWNPGNLPTFNIYSQAMGWCDVWNPGNPGFSPVR